MCDSVCVGVCVACVCLYYTVYSISIHHTFTTPHHTTVLHHFEPSLLIRLPANSHVTMY